VLVQAVSGLDAAEWTAAGEAREGAEKQAR